MSIKDAARLWFLERGSNCAEAVFLGADEALGLNLSEDAKHAVGAFGGGMGCGEACGALCGAIAALGVSLIQENAHATPLLKPSCTMMRDRFLSEFGAITCAELKPVHFKEGERCAALVEKTAGILEEILANTQSQ